VDDNNHNPPMMIHRVSCTHPDQSQTAATLAIYEGQLLIIPIGEVEALNHYPVIRGTPHLRVRPDVIEDYKQKEAQFALFPLAEVLTWTEYIAYPLQDVTVTELTVDTMQIRTDDGTYRFGFRLVDAATVHALDHHLRG